MRSSKPPSTLWIITNEPRAARLCIGLRGHLLQKLEGKLTGAEQPSIFKGKCSGNFVLKLSVIEHQLLCLRFPLIDPHAAARHFKGEMPQAPRGLVTSAVVSVPPFPAGEARHVCTVATSCRPGSMRLPARKGVR